MSDYEVKEDALAIANVIQSEIENEITRRVSWSNVAEKYDGDSFELLILMTARTMCERMLTEIIIKNNNNVRKHRTRRTN